MIVDSFWSSFATCFAYLVAFASLLHLCLFSKSLKAKFAKAPLLDIWVALFIWIPPVCFLVWGTWMDLLACLLSQLAFLLAYCRLHSLFYLYFKKQGSGRLLKTLSESLGRPRVFLGFISTLFAIPVFLTIRFGQIFVYPLMILLLRFPHYKHSEWIQLSRHKFDGLIGLDLLWCLYCEWAAGVYSLGAEMVRNNESFWCPIRFYDSKHCENCTVDFPDLSQWIPPDKKIDEVESLLRKQYPKTRKVFGWYNHPSRKGD